MSEPPAGALLAGSTAAVAVSEVDQRWLTPAERARADAFVRDGDRADYIAAHVVARRCAALVLGTAPQGLTLVQRCPDCGQAGHGPPGIAEAPHLRLSLAHTRGYVAAVADTTEVAVDAERLATRTTVGGVAGSVLTPAEQALIRTSTEPELTFVRIWVRKESLVKLGLATLDTLPDLDVSQALADSATWRGYAVHGWTALSETSASTDPTPTGTAVGAVIGRRVPALIHLYD